MNGATRRILPVLLALGVNLLASSPAAAQRIRDLARVQGEQAEHLVGMGLVIGLQGTGDSQQNGVMKKHYRQLIVNMGLGDDITMDDLRTRNTALVFVSATVSSSLKVGSEFESMVTSAGDAESLRGGYLLAVPLKPAAAVRRVDGRAAPVYFALAQGMLIAGGDAEKVTVARAKAVLQRPIDDSRMLHNLEDITLNLKEPDYGTASRITAKINEHDLFRDPNAKFSSRVIAHAVDESTVRVKIPTSYLKGNRVIDFISQVMEIEVPDIDREARVAIDRASGTVVINGEVRVAHSSLLNYKGAFIRIPRAKVEAEPEADDELELVRDDPFEENPLLIDVIQELEDELVGFTGKDLVTILELLDDSGAIIGKFIDA